MTAKGHNTIYWFIQVHHYKEVVKINLQLDIDFEIHFDPEMQTYCTVKLPADFCRVRICSVCIHKFSAVSHLRRVETLSVTLKRFWVRFVNSTDIVVVRIC